jgi:esterase/lipase superfamily enzyme
MAKDRFKHVGMALTVLLLAGCAQNIRPLNELQSEAFAVQPVYFATTRNDSGNENLNKRFGAERHTIQFGVGTVAVPADYPKAHSASFVHWNMTLKRNPEKHLALVNVDMLSPADFLIELAGKTHPDEPVLVFIHGFNTPFERANRISAKLAYDLNLNTPALLFAWPSNDRPSSYPADEDNLAWSQPYFNQFLKSLYRALPEQRFIFLGHSMGTRALSQGLIDVFEEHPEWATRVQGVVFAAPDIDSDIFQRDIIPALSQWQLPMTLYASKRDWAMIASNQLHKYPRAGFAGEDLVIVEGLTTIDASEAEAELLGHEYFSQGAHTVQDIYQWLILERPPQDRGSLTPVRDDRGMYWQFKPD